jgi:hypothetical protein
MKLGSTLNLYSVKIFVCISCWSVTIKHDSLSLFYMELQLTFKILSRVSVTKDGVPLDNWTC